LFVILDETSQVSLQHLSLFLKIVIFDLGAFVVLLHLDALVLPLDENTRIVTFGDDSLVTHVVVVGPDESGLVVVDTPTWRAALLHVIVFKHERGVILTML